MNHYSVYSDGSSGGDSTGAIGWGWLIVKNGQYVINAGNGGADKGTNNIAELMGAIEGLRVLLGLQEFTHQPAAVELVSDSKYVLGLASGEYEPTKNLDLAKILRDMVSQHGVRTKWVKGHNGNPLNEMCDRLAKLGKSQYMPLKITKRDKRRERKSLVKFMGK